MGKTRANTRRHLHRARLRVLREAKAEVRRTDTGFMYRHNDSMRKMLKGVDLDGYEDLASGG